MRASGTIAGIAVTAAVLAGCGTGIPESELYSIAESDAVAAQDGSAAEETVSPSDIPSEWSMVGDDPGATGSACAVLPGVQEGRWDEIDRPALVSAFADAGLSLEVTNAGDDPEEFLRLTGSMIDGGCTVLIVAPLDDESAVSAIRLATEASIPVVQYDGLTPSGGADYLVWVDAYARGQAIGESLVDCLRAAGKLAGTVATLDGPADDSALAQTAAGYQDVLAKAGYAVTPWGEDVPLQGLETISGIAAASEALAGKAAGAAAGVLLAAPGSSPESVQRVLMGSQCATVASPIAEQAYAAAQLASALVSGDAQAAAILATTTLRDPLLGLDVPTVALSPVLVNLSTMKDLVADGLLPTDALCSPEAAAEQCRKYEIS